MNSNFFGHLTLFSSIDKADISDYTVYVITNTVGGGYLHIIVSNSSDLPIYAQIKEQVKELVNE